MNLQVFDALGIKGKVFVLGTSQGRWTCVRMALLAPERITGIIPAGTSMASEESSRTRELGCWNGFSALTDTIAGWTSKDPTTDFEPTDEYCDLLISSGFGPTLSPELRQFWIKTVQANYQGDDGRKRARMAAINLRERDGLHSRLSDVRCPVLWLHWTKDAVYIVANAEEEIRLFINSPEAKLQVIEDGQHFLTASHPAEVDRAVWGL